MTDIRVASHALQVLNRSGPPDARVASHALHVLARSTSVDLRLASHALHVLATRAAPDPLAQEVLADKPYAYYRLGEPAGSPTMVDSSGFDRSGTYAGGVALGAAPVPTNPSVLDRAADLANGRGVVPSSSLPTPAAFTVECWFKPDTLGSEQYLASRWGATSGSRPWALGIATDSRLRFFAATGSELRAPEPLVAGERYHAVATYGASAATLYINGVAVASTTSFIAPATTARDLVVGAIYTSNYGFGFDGVLDEVAVYPSALSQSRVAAHYNAGTSPASAVEVSGTLRAASRLSAARTTVAVRAGQLRAASRVSATRSPVFPRTGTARSATRLQAAVVPIMVRSGSLRSAGRLSSTATPSLATAAVLGFAGRLSAATSTARGVDGTLPLTTGLAASTTPLLEVTASLVGQACVTAEVASITGVVAELGVASRATATGLGVGVNAAILQVKARVSAEVAASVPVDGQLGAFGRLQASVSPVAISVASVSVRTVVGAETVPVLEAAATLRGVLGLSAGTVQVQIRAANLTGIGKIAGSPTPVGVSIGNLAHKNLVTGIGSRGLQIIDPDNRSSFAFIDGAWDGFKVQPITGPTVWDGEVELPL